MIRNLIAVVRGVLARPEVRLGIAGGALSWGISTLVDIVGELRDEMTQLGQSITVERERLASLEQAAAVPVSPGDYPDREDLNPLHTTAEE